ncbi:membrane protein DedA with SNARE-associated domain [Thermodesulfitimonas autotrophica]|uniref:Membrane protein DedA with SNARE-associated domain n=1 Tax=Thermodesulfitimonas autotrophica TaxID=1894989 RepID=A0A3N5C109_9THEO|nr:membrane protein DedA with SNARE-associated domain [Thermodesulfitimonas autotrophica]
MNVKEFILDYLAYFGIGGLLLSSLVEALGVPFFPGGIMVILAGFLVARGYMTFPAALLATCTGFITGSALAYLLGVKLGGQVFELGGRLLKVTPARLAKARAYLGYSAPGFVVFGRFIPGISNLTPYLAGVGQLNPALFLALTGLFAVCWATLYLALGVFFEKSWAEVTGRLQPFLLLGGLLGLGLYLYLIGRRKKVGGC